MHVKHDGTDLNIARERKLSFAEVQHVEGLPGPVMPETAAGGHPINFLLIVACLAFGSSSFLFGFDNNVIGPIVALRPFVSLACLKKHYAFPKPPCRYRVDNDFL